SLNAHVCPPQPRSFPTRRSSDLFVARVARQVFVRPELFWVHEDGNHDEIGPAIACDIDQREVAVMEKAHGRDEADRCAVYACGCDGGAGFFDARGDDHRRPWFHFAFCISTTTPSPYSAR